MSCGVPIKDSWEDGGRRNLCQDVDIPLHLQLIDLGMVSQKILSTKNILSLTYVLLFDLKNIYFWKTKLNAKVKPTEDNVDFFLFQLHSWTYYVLRNCTRGSSALLLSLPLPHLSSFTKATPEIPTQCVRKAQEEALRRAPLHKDESAITIGSAFVGFPWVHKEAPWCKRIDSRCSFCLCLSEKCGTTKDKGRQGDIFFSGSIPVDPG